MFILKNECLILRFECLNSICPIKEQNPCTVEKAAINCECKRSKNNNQNFKTMKKEKNQDWQFIAVQTVIGLIGLYTMLFCIGVAFS